MDVLDAAFAARDLAGIILVTLDPFATKLGQETLKIGTDRYTEPSQVFEYFRYRYREHRKEYFLALLLDGKNRIIREVQISEGSLNQSIVHPREVFSPAASCVKLETPPIW